MGSKRIPNANEPRRRVHEAYGVASPIPEESEMRSLQGHRAQVCRPIKHRREVRRIERLNVEDSSVELSLEYAAMRQQLVAVSNVELSALTVTAIRIALINLAGTREARPAARRQDHDDDQGTQ